jgi:cation diffusion facilitator CzcD-associated flavoprotein CzcO
MSEAALAGQSAFKSGSGSTDAIVIGAGFSGMYMLHRLRALGMTVRGFEAGDGVGGTWYWNRYPGARCDSESMFYSYSFLSELEQEWPLIERYPGQPEVLRYLEHVADRLNLRDHFTFGAKITGAAYDETCNRWTVRTDDGTKASGTYLITAVGCLSAANTPAFRGAEQFRGESLHTGTWPHEPVNFAGKRVGVIGTGASGIQAIPVIAEQAAHLTVFQRTAQFTIPAANCQLDPQFTTLWKQNYQEWRRRGRHSAAGVPYPASRISALDVSPEDRRAAFEGAWEQGGFMFAQGTFGDLVLSEQANEMAADFVRSKIDEIVHDPAVAEMLKPRTFPFGTKRLPLDTNYYQTFNRSNVTLVDLRATPIEEITPGGVRTSETEYPLDIIVYATGFDALTGPLLALGIQGRRGLSLADAWSMGPKTFLGLAIPDFPNLFTITGPGSPSVLSNMPVSIEQHVEWISGCLGYLRDHHIATIEARRDAMERWTDHVQEVAGRTLYPKAASWYMGANIPGKPRLFLPYIGGVGNYRDKCASVASNGYEGFDLMSPPLAATA